jgi:hypothetical protein
MATAPPTADLAKGYLKEVQAFIDLAAPFATSEAKDAYRFPSNQEERLFGDCIDFCWDCADTVARRISVTAELAMLYLCRAQPMMARALWLSRANCMGYTLEGWRSASICETYPIKNDSGDAESLVHCHTCGVLLSCFADPTNDPAGEWAYWEGRANDDETALDEGDLAELYFFLHEVSDFGEESLATCERAALLLRQFTCSPIGLPRLP